MGAAPFPAIGTGGPLLGSCQESRISLPPMPMAAIFRGSLHWCGWSRRTAIKPQSSENRFKRSRLAASLAGFCLPNVACSLHMCRHIELVYDRLVAEERLKSGAKYERLAAIAFREINDHATVHDLRLRGETGVPHQIDVVVGDERKRVLIEAKDYDRVVDLPVVRNFWAVVEDLKPDDAFVVTTEGFSDNAVKYATAKGIRLAILRPPRDADWGNLVRRVALTITATGQTGPPNVTWQLHPDDQDKLDAGSDRLGLVETAEIKLSDEEGTFTEFLPMLDEQLNEDYGTVPLGGSATSAEATSSSSRRGCTPLGCPRFES